MRRTSRIQVEPSRYRSQARSRTSKRIGLVARLVVLIAALSVTPAHAYRTDSASAAPPSSGAFGYNSFVPALTPGASYVDPVFGETVHRITNDSHNDDIYARNMRWNADATRYLHDSPSSGFVVVDVATGAATHRGLPQGCCYTDAGFDPLDPNVLYYFSGSTVRKLTLQPGGTWTDTVYLTVSGTLQGLGGTINWLSANGRYMVLRYGAEPSVRVFDRQNLAAGPYGNALTFMGGGGGYTGISPDGNFVVAYGDGGFGGMGRGLSWAINHATRTVSTSMTEFWSLCGDHGSFTSASDGRNYMIVSNCWDQPELWRVDITNNAAGLNATQQRALPNNKRLILWPSWNFGCNHVSTVARGALQDWAFCSTEDYSDPFNGPVSPWLSYKQEIVAFNVLTGEIRRLAHHRSRGIGGDYYYQPRVSSSWTGNYVGFASNFNQVGQHDVYAVALVAPAGTTAPPAPTTTPTAPVTTAPSTSTSAPSPTATSTPPPTPPPAPVSLPPAPSPAPITSSTGATTTPTTTRTTSSTPTSPAPTTTAPPPPPTSTPAPSTIVTASTTTRTTAPTPTSTAPEPSLVSVTVSAPAAGATVEGPVTVSATASATGGVAGVQFQVDGAKVGEEVRVPPYSMTWRTKTASNGVHRLTAVVRDTKGQRVISPAVSVTVANPTVSISSPTPWASVSGTVTVSAVSEAWSGVASVQFKLDGRTLGAADTQGPYSIRWDTTGVPNGWHMIRAVVVDEAGVTRTSSWLRVKVSN